MRWWREQRRLPASLDEINALDADLDELLSGGSVQLADSELVDLAAGLRRDAEAIVVPPPGERRAQFLAQAPSGRRFGRSLAGRAVLVAATLVVVAGSVASASMSSKPGDALYPIHRAVDHVIWLVTGSPTEKANDYLNKAQGYTDQAVLARERAREAEALKFAKDAEANLVRARHEIARLNPDEAAPLQARVEAMSTTLAQFAAGPGPQSTVHPSAGQSGTTQPSPTWTGQQGTPQQTQQGSPRQSPQGTMQPTPAQQGSPQQGQSRQGQL